MYSSINITDMTVIFNEMPTGCRK